MKHHDPITGDELTNAEYISWHIQAVVRSPWFIIAFNLITIVMLAVGLRDWWNYFASWLAIMVEWVVGKYMFGQTQRDAACLREIRAVSRRVEAVSQVVLRDVTDLEELAERPSVAPYSVASPQPGTPDTSDAPAQRTNSPRSMDVHADNASLPVGSSREVEEG